jgi:HAD superfamily hydrolase (TIGR01509 family)
MSLFSAGRRIEAVLFDMDGTLICSEDRTDAAVLALLAEQGIDDLSGFDLSHFHGVTWAAIADALVGRWPVLDGRDVAMSLQRCFHQNLADDPPHPMPGAVKALATAASMLPVAIVTSSNRETMTLVCKQLQITDLVTDTVCAEDCRESKPSPEPFSLAARRLNVAPERCLIFEDSVAGVRAGIAAGAAVIAVGPDSGHAPWITDFEALPVDFFARSKGHANG